MNRLSHYDEDYDAAVDGTFPATCFENPNCDANMPEVNTYGIVFDETEVVDGEFLLPFYESRHDWVEFLYPGDQYFDTELVWA